MSESSTSKPGDASQSEDTTQASNAETAVVASQASGPVSQWLQKQGFEHDVLEPDHLGVEQIGVESVVLPIVVAALKSTGFDYLQCQGVTTKDLAKGWFASITFWRCQNRFRRWLLEIIQPFAKCA